MVQGLGKRFSGTNTTSLRSSTRLGSSGYMTSFDGAELSATEEPSNEHCIAHARSTDKTLLRRGGGNRDGRLDDTQGKEGRVKVQFPWFDDQMETEWCRVAQLYAGNGYGAVLRSRSGRRGSDRFVRSRRHASAVDSRRTLQRTRQAADSSFEKPGSETDPHQGEARAAVRRLTEQSSACASRPTTATSQT